MVELLYFAWVRERIGRDSERLELPPEVADVGALLAWLPGLSAGHAAALAERSRIRVAVNQEFADERTPVADGDEVAIFPPVTGG